MDYYDILLAKKLNGGGGSSVEVEPLSVTENGTYEEEGKAFSPVTVSVPQGVFPSGTYSITQNGIYDITDFASASVSVSQGVFPSGTYSITENGIYDVTNFASASVNVSGGEDLLTKNLDYTLSGAYTYNGSYLKSYAFLNCSLLTSINFPSCTSIGNGAFSYCTSLTSVSFPSCTSIGSYAFYNCNSLTSVNFPSCTSMGSNAFANCSSLTSASFPVCTNIGRSVFQLCSSLTSLYLLNSVVATLSTNVFLNTPMASTSYLGYYGSIFVPASLVDSYKTATNWASVSDRITAYTE